MTVMQMPQRMPRVRVPAITLTWLNVFVIILDKITSANYAVELTAGTLSAIIVVHGYANHVLFGALLARLQIIALIVMITMIL